MIGYIFLVIFIFVSLADLYAVQKENKKIERIAKPLLMPLLILFYVLETPLLSINWFIVVGLAFGTLGDIFLMLDEKWFLHGMIAFLINQISYIIAFFVMNTNILAFPSWGFTLFLPAVILLYFILPRILDKTGDLKIPVIIYLIALVMMHFSATLTLSVLSGLSVVLIYLGSLLYVFSDSFVALDRFEKQVPQASLIAMATYILCQFYITLGIFLITAP
ncbi:MAG: lysoplasmalogenase [Promethearchaeota archaeon]